MRGRDVVLCLRLAQSAELQCKRPNVFLVRQLKVMIGRDLCARMNQVEEDYRYTFRIYVMCHCFVTA